MRSSAWLHVIDTKTSYNVLLGRPWIHENKVVPYTYHQCLKYYEGEVEKTVVADDEPFTEAESHFADAKFYLKNRIVKELKVDDGMKSKNDEPITKRAEVTIGKAKVVTEEIPANLFAKAGYNPNELSKLGKLPSKAATRQPHEGLGYKQLSPVRISIRRACSNYITIEDESAASNRPYVFDRLGKSTMRTSVFERLGPLKKGNKLQRNHRNTRTPASPKIQEISKDFQSLVPSRMRRQTKLMVSCEEVLKVKPYTVVYTKERNKDEESVGSSYHITVQGENSVSSSMEDNVELEDVSPFRNGARPVKQAQRRFRPDLVPLIETKVNKLIEAGFIREVKYPTWVSSIVPVRKKNGQIRVCVDFRDLNNACPKDEFSLPIPELMIDTTTDYEAMSFMDGSSGSNQIRMEPKDEELTAFRTPKGIYCYNVMPFVLKNAGATYQRAMQNIFDDLLHKNFLGLIVRHRGIEIDQAKVNAILKMPKPRDIHELKSLQEKLAYL
ncbi:uncharacterized protein [Nicotiana sylvestris]|uniref:uncharacterized protein n=1 Tax=Nicotiana sylvestris TaxID=4096 RepID=UPI00388C4834